MKKVKNKKTFGILISAVCVLSLAAALSFGIIGMMATPKDSTSNNGISDSTNKLVNQDLGNVLTNTVELKISKELLELNEEEFDYTLTQEQKDNGFTGVKKNADGSATFTIKRKDYNQFIKECREETKKSFDEMNADGAFASVKKIEYTEKFEKVTITADKSKFENSLDGMCVFGCGLASCLYQMYDIDAPGKCTVEVKDSATGEVFQTTVYPEALDN